MPKAKLIRRLLPTLLGLLWFFILGGCQRRDRHSVNLPPIENHPPTASCSTNRSTLLPGETADVFITPSDPQGSLSYTWFSPYGSLEADGPSARWTANVPPGTYDISVEASNDRGASIACSVTIVVRSPAEKDDDSRYGEIPQLPRLPAWTLNYTLPAGVAIRKVAGSFHQPRTSKPTL